jgi:hypothetical protein
VTCQSRLARQCRAADGSVRVARRASWFDDENKRGVGARQTPCELIGLSPCLGDAHARSSDHTAARGRPVDGQIRARRNGRGIFSQRWQMCSSRTTSLPPRARPGFPAISSCIHFEQSHTIWSTEDERGARLLWNAHGTTRRVARIPRSRRCGSGVPEDVAWLGRRHVTKTAREGGRRLSWLLAQGPPAPPITQIVKGIAGLTIDTPPPPTWRNWTLPKFFCVSL